MFVASLSSEEDAPAAPGAPGGFAIWMSLSSLIGLGKFLLYFLLIRLI